MCETQENRYVPEADVVCETSQWLVDNWLVLVLVGVSVLILERFLQEVVGSATGYVWFPSPWCRVEL